MFHILLDSDNEELPHIYWHPKLRKNSSKCRLIVAASRYSVKPLQKALNCCIIKLSHTMKEVSIFHELKISGQYKATIT